MALTFSVGIVPRIHAQESIFCPVDPENCPDQRWQSYTAIYITVAVGIPITSCSLKVACSKRVDCPARPCEVRIDAIEYLSCSPSGSWQLSGEFMDKVASELVKSGNLALCPLPAYPDCRSDYYINASVCYARINSPLFSYPVALPCVDDCCQRTVTICNTGGGTYSTSITYPNPYPYCPEGQTYPYPPVPCINTCSPQ